MGLFNNQAPGAAPDKNSAAYAVMRFNSARSNLLIALILTVVNIVLDALGAGVYMLFSLAFPYYFLDLTDLLWSIPALVVLGLYIVFYLCCKKKPGFMIAALVFFILDCVFLVGYSILLANTPELEITYADFILDYVTHVWLLICLIPGARYSGRYRAAITADPTLIEGNLLKNAAIPTERAPIYTVEFPSDDPFDEEANKEEEKRYCPHCGAVVSTENFCPSCGTKLK